MISLRELQCLRLRIQLHKEGRTINNWINDTILRNKELQAPFIIKKDSDYYNDLRKRLTYFIKLLKNASADDESLKIAKYFSDKVCESLRDYYKGNVSACHQKIENLIKKCSTHELAVSMLNESSAFPGTKGTEIQFFRARKETVAQTLKLKDMLHLPFSLRGKSGNYRFSIPGVTSLYLANTSYGCWIEMEKPSEHDFYVAPVFLDGKQKIFNLAVSWGRIDESHYGDEEYIHCWIKLLVMMFATSYKTEESNRSFKSEYIISQCIMLACKHQGYDGVAYFSKQVENEAFALAAINLALFAGYEKNKEFGEICRHLKIDEPLNYQLFKQLSYDAAWKKYSNLRVDKTGLITNINGFKHQYSYRETEFFRFDQHLFGRWTDKDTIPWGNALDE